MISNGDTFFPSFYRSVAVWQGRRWVSFLRSCVKEWKNHNLLGANKTDLPSGESYRLFLGKNLRKVRNRLAPSPPPISSSKSTKLREERRPRSLKIELISAPPTFNVLVPSLRPEHIFGGITTAVHFAFELCRLGEKIRFITTDYAITKESEAAVLHSASRHLGKGAIKNIAFADATLKNENALQLGASDEFVATAWWTAHFIHRALRENPFEKKKFIYLIQDFEPGFYAWGEEYNLAETTYRFGNFLPVFNTSFLESFFRQQGYSLDKNAVVISPDVDPKIFFPESADALQKRLSRPRVFVYGRPSVDRNLFSTAIEALKLFITKSQLTPETIEIVSAGEFHAPVECDHGVKIESVGKLDYQVYPQFLRTFDIGLSLMLSPHPSYPPLEMAASGLVTVTNRFATKDLSAVSTNFISCDSDVESIAHALGKALSRTAEIAERIRGKDLKFKDSQDLPQTLRTLCHNRQTASE